VELLTGIPTEGGHTVLAMSGEVDVYTAPALRAQLADLLNLGRRQLVIDLTEVEFLDSTWLGILIAGLKKSREQGGRLSLVCSRASLLKLFAVTGLDQVFVIHRTVPDAVAAGA
jgi:anti-sigma B factor antagonist